jgi:glycosyltransferase involved in cell wall biosynthesis
MIRHDQGASERAMNAPVVSIITIFLNAEAFLAEAIESVLAQTYVSWELLLIDDGSSDGSSELARTYAADHPRKIRYLEHPGHVNRGMSASRNLGVSNAHGPCIAFLDADDVWLPEALAERVRLLDDHPTAAMVYGRTEIWYSWTGKPDDLHRDFTYDLGVPPDSLVQPPTLLILLLQNEVQNPTTCSALIRRQLFQQVGGFVEAFRGLFEDQAFFAKVCLKAPVFVSGAKWARYRQHPDSCCAIAERNGTAFADRLPLLRWIEQYFTDEAVTDERVWQALRLELSRYGNPD